jgi:tetratricopeptide (TPR) repeat protein
MIKFFRKIRQNLLTENKFSKYMLYAIGEIILVVIGILIALQINNWNEYRKAYNNELQLYLKILDDIHDQYSYTKSERNSMKSYQDLHFDVYNQSQGKSRIDSNLYYNTLEWVFPFHLSISEKYTESLSTITNDTIRDLLKIYITREKQTSDAYGEWNDLKVQRLRPFFNKHGIHNTEAIFNADRYSFSPLMSADLIEYPKLIKQYGSTELDELLYDLRFKTSWIFSNLNSLKNANYNLELALIDELKNTKLGDEVKRMNPKKLPELLKSRITIDQVIEIIKKDNNNSPVYDFSESEINSWGYDLIYKDNAKDALKIFKLNTELFPNAYNTYDSYGECLLKLGDQQNAIEAYRKSLELNPYNESAIKVLAELK